MREETAKIIQLFKNIKLPEENGGNIKNMNKKTRRMNFRTE